MHAMEPTPIPAQPQDLVTLNEALLDPRLLNLYAEYANFQLGQGRTVWTIEKYNLGPDGLNIRLEYYIDGRLQGYIEGSNTIGYFPYDEMTGVDCEPYQLNNGEPFSEVVYAQQYLEAMLSPTNGCLR